MMHEREYLNRINYAGSVEPSATTLRALHLAHLESVPFENLDIHLGRPIELNLPALFDKIVVRHRGGFWYELNGLFAWLLQRLGFEVTLLSARDAHDDGDYGPEFDHLTLCVRTLSNPSCLWLTDVGWGDTFCEPLKIGQISQQIQRGRAYRLEQDGDDYVLWQKNYDGTWERHYRFTLQARSYQDFAAMCRYHQTSAESLFVQKRICTRLTHDGRITLDAWRLITTTDGQRQEQLVDEESYHDILKVYFGVEV